jgi:MFS family permease
MSILGGLRGIITLLSSVSSLLWGKLSDMAGRKPFIVLSYALRVIAIIVCIFAGAWPLLILYAIFMGLSASFQQHNPAVASLIAESVSREERGTAYGVIMASSTIASALVAPLGGILAIIWGFRPIFIGCILADLLGIILTVLFIEETLKDVHAGSKVKEPLINTLKSMITPEPHLWGFYISLTVDAFAWGLGSYILYGMLVKTYGFTKYQLGLLSTVLSLVWGISQVPIGKLIDKYGRKLFLLISELVGMISLVGWLFSRSFISFAILQIPFALMIATWVPAIAALLADSVPMERRGQAMGRLQAFRGIFAFPAPYIGGLLFDTYGFRAPIFTNLIGAILAFILIFLLVREEVKSAKLQN